MIVYTAACCAAATVAAVWFGYLRFFFAAFASLSIFSLQLEQIPCDPLALDVPHFSPHQAHITSCVPLGFLPNNPTG